MFKKLQVTLRELALETAISKLDKYQLLSFNRLAYVTKAQTETSVLFELISILYERRSILITANQPFGELEPSLPRSRNDARRHRPLRVVYARRNERRSYRRRTAVKRKQQGAGRLPQYATIRPKHKPCQLQLHRPHQSRRV